MTEFLTRVLIVVAAPLGAAVVSSGSALADPAAPTSPSYQLGYDEAVRDVGIMASRMRAEGFQLADINISSRIPTLCARESDSAQTTQDFDSQEFLRGCTDAMKNLVSVGIAY